MIAQWRRRVEFIAAVFRVDKQNVREVLVNDPRYIFHHKHPRHYRRVVIFK